MRQLKARKSGGLDRVALIRNNATILQATLTKNRPWTRNERTGSVRALYGTQQE